MRVRSLSGSGAHPVMNLINIIVALGFRSDFFFDPLIPKLGILLVYIIIPVNIMAVHIVKLCDNSSS